jgi:hypothetical protein
LLLLVNANFEFSSTFFAVLHFRVAALAVHPGGGTRKLAKHFGTTSGIFAKNAGPVFATRKRYLAGVRAGATVSAEVLSG